MSDNTRLEELLALFVEDELSGPERAEFQAMMDADPGLARRAEEERRIVHMIQGMPRPAAPAGLDQAVLAGLRSQPGPVVDMAKPADSKPPAKKSMLPWMMSVAAVAIAGLVGVIAFQGGGDEQAPQEVAMTAPEMKTPAPAAEPEVPARARADRQQEILSEAKTTVETARRKSGVESTASDADAEKQKGVDKLAFGATAAAGGNLPSRENVEEVIERNYGKFVLDTSYYDTAQYFFEGEPGERIAGNKVTRDQTRYIVVETESPELAVDLYESYRAEFFSYSTEDTGPMIEDDGRLVLLPYMLADVDTDGDIDLLLRNEGIALKSEGGTIEAPELADFDAFMELMRKENGRFMFYTSDRPIAFEQLEESAVAMADELEKEEPKTLGLRSMMGEPAPTATPEPTATLRPGFTGYIVYQFDDLNQAEAMLTALPHFRGEGVANLDLDNAELVAQPRGARLIIPYRMPEID